MKVVRKQYSNINMKVKISLKCDNYQIVLLSKILTTTVILFFVLHLYTFFRCIRLLSYSETAQII